MSLLIKALDKAQNAKIEEAQAQNAKTEEAQAQTDKLKSERVSAMQKQTTSDKAIENAADMVLSLAPATRIIDELTVIDEPALVNALLADAGVVKSGSTLAASPKNAANLFTAKGKEAGSGNKNLAIIAGLALLALLGMGAYFVQFIVNTPDMAIPARAIVAPPTSLPALPKAAPIETIATQAAPVPMAENPTSASVKSSAKLADAKLSDASLSDETTAFEPRQFATKVELTHKKLTKKNSAPNNLALSDDEASANADVVEPGNANEVNETQAPIRTNNKTGKSKTGHFGEAIASNSASISVTKSQAKAGVNPTLMSAYEAYNAGKDSEAQKLYKQVLQHDVRNVDALLGMGAIAQRQGRAADANGWYGKVLEVEPRNNIAQAALIDSQPQGNELNNETHLKNMLAKQPDDANLHVALGNLYAEQNQWPAAQQAYFEAYRLHASADNAFNLAVSLDQMGKPKLALPYYQRALALAQTGSNGIDKAALEARIAAIQ